MMHELEILKWRDKTVENVSILYPAYTRNQLLKDQAEALDAGTMTIFTLNKILGEKKTWLELVNARLHSRE